MAEPRTPRPRPRGEPRRSVGSLAVSLALHVVLVMLVAQALLEPRRIAGWLSGPRTPDPQERVVYVQPPSAPAAAGVPGGSTQPDEEDEDDPATRQGAPLVAPSEVPTGIPAPPPGAPAGTPDGVRGGTPGGRGRGSPTEGLTPVYTDPRLWGPVQPAPSAPRTTAQTVDSLISRDLESYRDSLSRAADARQPGDWTFERGGQKWGIDQQYIRLGKVSIPTALLGLLPINAQGNPQAIERDRSMSAIRRQIDNVERWQTTNASLRDQAKEMRERIDREREIKRQRERMRSGETVADPPGGSSPDGR